MFIKIDVLYVFTSSSIILHICVHYNVNMDGASFLQTVLESGDPTDGFLQICYCLFIYFSSTID